MNPPSLSSETIHASCVSIEGAAVLIAGRSGSGKSDLSLRLIDRGARLVSDDYTLLRRVEGRLLASPPAKIAGRIEMRGIGLLTLEHVADVPVALLIDLDRMIERMPMHDDAQRIAGVTIPTIGIPGLEASAPLKVEAALKFFGLK